MNLYTMWWNVCMYVCMYACMYVYIKININKMLINLEETISKPVPRQSLQTLNECR